MLAITWAVLCRTSQKVSARRLGSVRVKRSRTGYHKNFHMHLTTANKAVRMLQSSQGVTSAAQSDHLCGTAHLRFRLFFLFDMWEDGKKYNGVVGRILKYDGLLTFSHNYNDFFLRRHFFKSRLAHVASIDYSCKQNFTKLAKFMKKEQ